MSNKRQIRNGLWAVMTAALLTACASAPPVERVEVEEEPAVELERDTAPAPRVPDSVQQALVPPAKPLDSGRPEEPRFDLSVSGVPAREFFMGLVEGTRYNMVVHPSVTGEVSLSLKDVSVPEVMAAVREVFGYEYKRSDSGYFVLPSTPQTRIFHLDYLNVKRSGLSQTRVSSGQVSERVGSGGQQGRNNNSDNNNRGSNNGAASSQTALDASRVETRSEADFWAELRTSLNAIAAADPNSSVVMTPQAGLLVVRARPDVLRQVEEYVESLEDSLQRQVILEAKILEVELKEGFQAGINWAALGEPQSGETIVAGQTGGGRLQRADDLGIFNGESGRAGLLGGVDTSTFGGAFSAALNLNDFAALIELLKSQGDVQVLSSPRVATVNNQKAIIKVGNDEFFVTDVQSDTTSVGDNAVVSPDITLTPFFSGIALDVTPQIGRDDFVTLHIHPAVTEVSESNKSIVVAGQTQNLPLAFSTIRESDSIVRARSGQVVVIGGLMQDRQAENRAATPVLGELPLVGGLFRHTSRSSVKKELVILLKPVVVDERDWDRRVEESVERYRGLRERSLTK